MFGKSRFRTKNRGNGQRKPISSSTIDPVRPGLKCIVSSLHKSMASIFMKHILSILTLVLATTPLWSQDDRPSFSFVHLGDPQIGFGPDGLAAPPGADAGYDDFVGLIANENPWEFQHKVRFGQPGTPMPAQDILLTLDEVSDLSAYAQTLPDAP